MTARRIAVLIACSFSLSAAAADAPLQVKATVPAGPMTPEWNKGIQPISRDSYWNAVECGKKAGAKPLCVFPDTDFCKNPDYTFALFTPYKQVAYEVWQEVRAKREPPTPSYADAQKTRITVGVTQNIGAKNPLTTLVIKRGGKTIPPATQSLDGGGGRFIFDFAAFAPTAPITIELTGKTRTVSCTVGTDVLRILR